MTPAPPVLVELASKGDCPALAALYCRTILPAQPMYVGHDPAEVERDWLSNFRGFVECSHGLHPHDALLRAVRPAAEGGGRGEVVGFALWWLKRRKGRGEGANDLVGVHRKPWCQQVEGMRGDCAGSAVDPPSRG